jgi:hypothetical protein
LFVFHLLFANISSFHYSHLLPISPSPIEFQPNVQHCFGIFRSRNCPANFARGTATAVECLFVAIVTLDCFQFPFFMFRLSSTGFKFSQAVNCQFITWRWTTWNSPNVKFLNHCRMRPELH